ncbi:hypothetical protein AXA44_28205 [Rhodococcus sp. SC4]|nr:hypothetical protein AXA44_28205 [Rhodococcus sp. SC4]
MQFVLGRHAGLQFASAFEFGIQFCTEEQRQIGDPEPQQEHDHAGQGAVRLVVAAEVGDVQTEQDRREDPRHDGEERTGADPAELRLLHVGRDVIEDGHGDHDDAEDERPAGDVPDGQGGVAESDRVTHRACDGAAQREHRRSGGHQDQTDDGDGQHQRPELPHGTPLLDFVHTVHGASERPDVAGRRPHRAQQAEDQRHARGRCLDQLRDGFTQRVHGGGRPEVVDHLQDRIGGALPLPEHSQQRDQRQQRREQRQHRVIRQCGGQVGALIAREFVRRLPDDVPPGGFRQVRRRIRLPRIVGVRFGVLIVVHR